MNHGPAAKLEVDHATGKKTRLGVILFIVYSLIYAGFVAIGVLNYELMGKELMGGLNLAVIYGFGLIVFAIVLGLIYHLACSNFENKMNKEEQP